MLAAAILAWEEFWKQFLPPHIGSPTPRRLTAGVGVAVASRPREAARMVVVSFMVDGLVAVWEVGLDGELRWQEERSLTSAACGLLIYIFD